MLPREAPAGFHERVFLLVQLLLVVSLAWFWTLGDRQGLMGLGFCPVWVKTK